MNDLLRAIIKSACDTFKHLKIIEVASPSDGLGLLAFEITNDYNTVYFPAVGGYITAREAQNQLCLPNEKSIEESATSEYFSELREENAVINPVKVIISSRAWSATLVALDKNVKKLEKIATLANDLWVIDKSFIEMLHKVSSHGLLSTGSARLCCGITPDEYGSLTNDSVDNRSVKRYYPGGGFAYQDLNCDVFVEMNKKTFLPAYPFHRCSYCRRWLHRHVKKKFEETKDKNALEEAEQSSTKKKVKLVNKKPKCSVSKGKNAKTNKGMKQKKRYEDTTSDESETLSLNSDFSEDEDEEKSKIKRELEVIIKASA